MIVAGVSEAGRAVGVKELVCICVCVCLERVCVRRRRGDLTCNSSSQRFPTLLFSAGVRLCSSVSSHVVISALAGSLLKVKAQQHNVISLRQSSFSIQTWALFSPLSESAVLSLLP